jgi:hypothetical protein
LHSTHPALLFFFSFCTSIEKGEKKMENNNEWEKRRRLYKRNNSIVFKLFMKLYYLFEELIWLGVGVGILVAVLKIMFALGLISLI